MHWKNIVYQPMISDGLHWQTQTKPIRPTEIGYYIDAGHAVLVSDGESWVQINKTLKLVTCSSNYTGWYHDWLSSFLAHSDFSQGI